MIGYSLTRSEVRFDLDAIRSFYFNKRILITGAAGSIGSALALKLARLGCVHLAMLDHFDHGLLDIVERVRHETPEIQITEALCDIRDRQRLDWWMRRIQPDVVIHAAALKHVHLGERHPGECVQTNLVGASNALAAAVDAGVSHFTLISSDKAAAPTCVMGATKRLAEMLLTGFARERPSPMKIRAVRFGNVLGSQGSVLPRFEAQIEAGGPLEVTHPEMERFFMSASEAVGLILSVTGLDGPEEGGAGTYLMEMGEPISILNLGRDLIRRSGKSIDIAFTGLRPGEKLKEQLSDEFEASTATSMPGVFRITPWDEGAFVTLADVAQLEGSARTMEPAVFRRKVFAQLGERLGRQERSVG